MDSSQTQISPDQIYGCDRAILVDTPVCTAAEYARRTGLSLSVVKSRLADRRIPTIKQGNSTLVNMMALAKEAIEQEVF